MKRLICLALLACLPACAWNPFKGRTGYVISVVALSVAHACDFQTTEQVISSGAGHEANPVAALFVENRNHFIAFKIGAGVVPITAELILLRKRPQLRDTFTKANWSGAGLIGGVAAHNRSIYLRSQ